MVGFKVRCGHSPVAEFGTTASNLDPIIHAFYSGLAAEAGESNFVVDLGCGRIVVRDVQYYPEFVLFYEKTK